MARSPDNALWWATLTVLTALGTAVTATTNPGIVTRITQKGLDYGNHMPSIPPLHPKGHLLSECCGSCLNSAHAKLTAPLTPVLHMKKPRQVGLPRVTGWGALGLEPCPAGFRVQCSCP